MKLEVNDQGDNKGVIGFTKKDTRQRPYIYLNVRVAPVDYLSICDQIALYKSKSDDTICPRKDASQTEELNHD